MNLAVVLESRFDRTPDGAVWTGTVFTHHFWRRYLEVFDRVIVVARVREVQSATPSWERADGKDVSFAAVPHYLGPWQYLIRVRQVRRAAKNAIAPNDAVILRVASHIASPIARLLSMVGHPYGLEVVGDPYDVFAPGAVKHPMRPFFRWWFSKQLRRQCASACAVAYVTKDALQRRYPPTAATYSTHYSDVVLQDDAFATVPRRANSDNVPGRFSLLIVGSLAQLYKAPDILISAVGACIRDGLDLDLKIVGDGKHRAEVEAHVKTLGLSDRVNFLGQLPAGESVRDQLDKADLFVLPSRTEGLPRAMIEAMARALPCIGTTVGGIPELLTCEDMVPPGDTETLAQKIREVVIDQERMARMSARNLRKAKEYHEEHLRVRRREFYRYVRERTEAWLAKDGGRR